MKWFNSIKYESKMCFFVLFSINLSLIDLFHIVWQYVIGIIQLYALLSMIESCTAVVKVIKQNR